MIMKHIFLIGFILLSHSSFSSEIEVISAFWGNQDVTAQAKAYCDSKTECDYKISLLFIPKSTSEDQSFTIDWRCLRGTEKSELQTKAISGNAENKHVHLTCSDLFFYSNQEKKKVPLNQSKYDFRSYLTNNDYKNTFMSDLGKNCYESVYDTMMEFPALQSPLLSGLVIPLKKVKNNLKFYHSSKAVSFIIQMSDQSIPIEDKFKSIFDHVRIAGSRWGRLNEEERRLGWKNFFIGSTVSSTKMYGNDTIEIKMSENSKILKYDADIWKKALEQIAADYPLIGKHCNLSQRGIQDAIGYVEFNNFIPVFATELGADILDYNQKLTWLMLLREKNVLSIERN